MGSRCDGGRKTETDPIPKPMTKRSVVMWPVSGEVSAGFGPGISNDMSAGSEKRLVGLKKLLDSFEILAEFEGILISWLESESTLNWRKRIRGYGIVTSQFNTNFAAHASVSPAWKGETLHQVEGTNQRLY